MKKFLAGLLVFVLAFTTCSKGVVYAAEIDDTVVDVVEDVSDYPIFADIVKDGTTVYKINDSEYLTATPYAGGLISLAGWGTTLLVSPHIATCVLILIGAGVCAYSLDGIVEEANKLYNLLSDWAKQELLEFGFRKIYELTEELTNEINRALQVQFYDEDGTFRELGITFDAANMIVYDYDSQFIYGDTYDPSFFSSALDTTKNSIVNTTLDAEIVETGDETFPVALKVYNDANGKSITLSTSDLINKVKLDLDCASYKLSSPTVTTYESSSGSTYHELGFWFLVECSAQLAGESCSEHSWPYRSFYVGDFGGFAGGLYATFSGFGNLLDQAKISSVSAHTDDAGETYFKYHLSNVVDGSDTIDANASLFSSVFGNKSYTLDLDSDVTVAGLDIGSKIHAPSDADSLTDVATWDRDGVLTGEYTADVPTDTTATWGNLWDWLADIVSAILSIPLSIWEFVSTGFDDVIDAILDLPLSDVIDAIISIPASIWDFVSTGFVDVIDAIIALPLSIWNYLTQGFTDVVNAINSLGDVIVDGITAAFSALFVPDKGFLDEILGVLSNKFGWIRDIFTIVKNVFDTISNSSNSNEPPTIKLNLSNETSKYDYGTGSIDSIKFDWYLPYKPYVDNVMSGFLWLMFVWKLFNVIPGIISGSSSVASSNDKRDQKGGNS